MKRSKKVWTLLGSALLNALLIACGTNTGVSGGNSVSIYECRDIQGQQGQAVQCGQNGKDRFFYQPAGGMEAATYLDDGTLNTKYTYSCSKIQGTAVQTQDDPVYEIQISYAVCVNTNPQSTDKGATISLIELSDYVTLPPTEKFFEMDGNNGTIEVKAKSTVSSAPGTKLLSIAFKVNDAKNNLSWTAKTAA